MTPERMADLVTRWVRFYTRNLPGPIAERRIDEINSDLHDQIAHDRARGTAGWRIALSLASRMVRGVAADAAWRGHHVNSGPEEAMKQPRTAHPITIGIFAATACILIVNLAAMQFTDEVAWGPADFVIVGALLAGLGLAHEVAARKARSSWYRAALAVAVGTALLLVFGVLALGVNGEDGDRADLMYGGVLAVGILGAHATRFRPEGMARTLLAMALAQMLIAGIALLAGKHQEPLSSALEIVGLNAFFAALFVGSAWLFRQAARAGGRQPATGI